MPIICRANLLAVGDCTVKDVEGFDREKPSVFYNYSSSGSSSSSEEGKEDEDEDETVFNFEPEPEPVEPEILPQLDIDPDGDLILKVKTKVHIKSFLTSSAVLYNASSVFRAMFGPRSTFKEAIALRSVELYTLDLEDDDLEAMGIILQYMHHKNKLVPDVLEFNTMVAVATIIDKYDLFETLRFVSGIWIDKWRPKKMEPGYEAWLKVAWLFRLADVYTPVSQRVILHGVMFPGDDTIRIGKSHLLDVPEVVANDIRERRREVFRSILQQCDFFLQLYTVDFSGTLCSGGSAACDNIVTGTLVREFGKLGLLPEPLKYDMSVSLREFLRRLESFPPTTIWVERSSMHPPCRPTGRNSEVCSEHQNVRDACFPISHNITCGFHTELEDNVRAIISKVEGLVLPELKPATTRSVTASPSAALSVP